MRQYRNRLFPAIIPTAAIIVVVAFVFTSCQRAPRPGDLTNLQPVTSADHILGGLDAPVKIIEFADLECPYCKEFHETLKLITQEYAAHVAWVYRHSPLWQIHPKAPYEAKASECAAKFGGNDVFWKYIDAIYLKTPSNNELDPAVLTETAIELGLDAEGFNACYTSDFAKDLIDRQVREAIAIGAMASGTPYSVIVLQNALSREAMKTLDDLNSSYPSNPPVFTVSADKKNITISGAVPLDAMRRLLSELTAQ